MYVGVPVLVFVSGCVQLPGRHLGLGLCLAQFGYGPWELVCVEVPAVTVAVVGVPCARTGASAHVVLLSLL